MRVLIGYDGSPGAQAAIADLQCAGLPDRVDGLVLAVAEVWPHLTEASFTASLGERERSALMERVSQLATNSMSEAHELAQRGGDYVQGLFPRWDVRCEACHGSPAQELLSKAASWWADLLVVGAEGRSAVERLLFGSVSQKVLSYAPCPVRIGRRSHRKPDAGMRLIVAVDGSPASLRAVSAAASRHWPAGSEAQAIVVMDQALSTVLPIFGQPADASWIQNVAADAAQELADSGLPATPRLLEGDPKRVLLREAESWPADSVFIGARGISRLERFLVGSVSEAVAARARCSVEVVRQESR